MMRKFGTATELVCALEIRCGINRHRGHALRRGDVNGGLATGRVSGLRSGKNGSSAKHKTSHQLSRLRNLRLSIFNTTNPLHSTPFASTIHTSEMATSPPPTSTGIGKVDAAKAKLAAADPTAPTGLALYSRFAFAGAVCCSVTHGALTPVDVYVVPPPNGSRRRQWLSRTRFATVDRYRK
jgi:hypothetical protein